ncbi:MAG: hypothetical protein KDC98_11530, partial [Planctomycetes bacterium]|nr:hypothetical protein [Planctomycetota bacterium]
MSRDAAAILTDLVARAMARAADGDPIELDELCRDQPELRADVERALRVGAGIDALHGSARAPDRRIGQPLGERYRPLRLL